MFSHFIGKESEAEMLNNLPLRTLKKKSNCFCGKDDAETLVSFTTRTLFELVDEIASHFCIK